VDEIAADERGLVMLMAKAESAKPLWPPPLLWNLRSGPGVHLTTSDPAAHLTDTLDGSMDNLT